MIQIKEVLGNKSIYHVLEYFLDNPTEKNHFNGLMEKRIVSGTATLSKAIRTLEKNEILNCTKIGNMNLYTLSRDHPLVKGLKRIKTIEMLLPLREIGKKYGCKIYVYGSRARGEDTKESDVDLLIITDSNIKEIQEEIEKLRMKKKLPINSLSLQVFRTLEWAKMVKKDSAFYERVERDKIELI